MLEEFFVPDGPLWRHKRVEAEIAKYLETAPEREAKKAGNKERKRRNREVRKALFDQLRRHGVVPEWDTPNAELRSILSRVATSSGHAPVTRDGTATQSPVTNTHTPEKQKQRADASPTAPPARGTRLKADWWPSEATEGWVMDEHPHVSFDNQLDAFRDYWTAKPGKDGRKLDWDATFRNWIRNSRQTARAGPTAKPKTVAAYDAIGAKIDELSTVVPGRDRPRIAGHDPAKP